MRTAIRASLCMLGCVLGMLGLLAAACNGDAANEPSEYLGCSTDENWRTLDDLARTPTDNGQAPVVLDPVKDGATLSAKPTFKWQVSSGVVGGANGTASCAKCPSCGMPGPLHEPAVSGDVYDLRFTVDGKLSWRVLTTQQTWTPLDATWSGWRGKSVSFSITRVVLKANDVQEGPYGASQPIVFSVTG